MFEFSSLTIALLVALAFGGMFLVFRSVTASPDDRSHAEH